METDKEKFISVLRSRNRKGIESVVSNLERIGFFTAPASAMHHLAVAGGLLKHSLNVYYQAILIREAQVSLNPALADRLPPESIAIAGLLHDVCKSDVYKVVEKFRKDANGRWEKYKAYNADYSYFPMGHGEKSVIQLTQWGLDMSEDEMLAIRWHMAKWNLPDDRESCGNFNAASEKCPLLAIIIAADELATRISEWNFGKECESK